MSKRTFNLIVGIAGGVQAIAVAIVTAVAPPYAVPIVAAIGIAETAVVEVCAQFREGTEE